MSSATTTGNPDRTLSGARRWLLIDMLRGIAIVLVLFRHHPMQGFLHDQGWMGVDLFFVLSGFLVAGLVFDEHKRTGSFRGFHFLVRRGFKIYPSFYAFIAVTMLMVPFTDREDPLMNYLAELFYFQNYHEGLWAHTWSLAVEEHFYFLLVFAASFLIWRRVRFSLRTMVVSCITLFIVILGLRIMTSLGSDFNVRTHMFPTHLRLDSLLAGVLLAAWHRYRPQAFHSFFRKNRGLLGISIILFLLPTLLSPFGSFVMATFGFTGIYLAGAVSVGLAMTAVPLKGTHPLQRVFVQPMAWIGQFSYTIYLWHLLTLVVIRKATAWLGVGDGYIGFVAYALLSIGVGYLTSVALEQPLLRMRERWFPSKSKAQVVNIAAITDPRSGS